MARTFGVRSAFFSGDQDENQAALVREEAEMLAMIRDAGITAEQLRPFLTAVARDEPRRRGG
jgi:hypothetical protein